MFKGSATKATWKDCQGVGRNLSHDGQLPKRAMPGMNGECVVNNNRFSLSGAVL